MDLAKEIAEGVPSIEILIHAADAPLAPDIASGSVREALGERVAAFGLDDGAVTRLHRVAGATTGPQRRR